MATRCASCSYPLSVSDSVVCYECSSYFHIDCAQLVGFPHYQLSSDPSRNTFLCATCVLLPLPARASDSDSGSDSDMPSRQQDYPLEPHADMAQDMAEVKGAVQDLSNLCKDMLREINEIKSINLTLRCGVENLRHENEERDNVIAELKRRLDILERGKTNIDTTSNETSFLAEPKDESVKETSPERPVHVFKTNLNENIKSEVKSYRTEHLKESRQDWTWKGSKAVELAEHSELCNEEESFTAEESVIKEETAQGWETLQEELESKYEIKEELVFEAIDRTNIENSNTYSNKYDSEHTLIRRESEEGVTTNEETEYATEELREETKSLPVTNVNDDISNVTCVENERVEKLIKRTFQEEQDNSDNETDEEEVHDTAQDITNETESKTTSLLLQGSSGIGLDKKEDNVSDDDANEDERGSVNSPSDHNDASKSEFTEDDEDSYETDTNDTIEEIHHEDLIEVEVGEIPEEEDNEELIHRDECNDNVEKTEEDGYRSELDFEKQEELCEEEVDYQQEIDKLLEDRPDTDERPYVDERTDASERLDAEDRLGESQNLEGAVPAEESGAEGGQRLGGQSPTEGEVQPSEPPPTPPPQHTEEDLWHYLKDAVTSERPSTVQEFLQNLIGTLQHVPEEYLQPVVEANIKRATSPTLSTDGEALKALEESVEKQDSAALEGGLLSESDAVSPPEEVAAELTEEGSPSDGDGFSAVEVAA